MVTECQFTHIQMANICKNLEGYNKIAHIIYARIRMYRKRVFLSEQTKGLLLCESR